RLEERAPLRELLDRVAAVAQDPLFAVDEADGAPARGRVDVARVVGHQSRVAAVCRDLDLAQVDCANRAVLDRDLVLPAGAVVDDRERIFGHAVLPGSLLAKDNNLYYFQFP